PCPAPDTPLGCPRQAAWRGARQCVLWLIFLQACVKHCAPCSEGLERLRTHTLNGRRTQGALRGARRERKACFRRPACRLACAYRRREPSNPGGGAFPPGQRSSPSGEASSSRQAPRETCRKARSVDKPSG